MMNPITCVNPRYPVVDFLTNITPLQQTAEALVTAGKIAILIVVAVNGGLFASFVALILMSATTAAYKALVDRFTLKEGPIKQLPPELLGEILLQLNQQNILSANMVSSGWQNAAMIVAKEEYLNLQIFITELSKDLDDSCEFVKNALVVFLIKELSFENLSLLEIKSINSNLFNRIINTLQFLDGKDLEKYLLANKQEGIFLLAKILKQFNPLFNREIATQQTMNEACFSIHKLIKMGWLDKLINCERNVPDEVKENYFKIISVYLSPFCMRLAKDGNYDDAICLAQKIPTDFYRTQELVRISIQLLNDGYKDKALDLSKTILKNISNWKDINQSMSMLSIIPTELLFHKDNQKDHLSIASSIITNVKMSDFETMLNLIDQNSCKNYYDQTIFFRALALNNSLQGYNLIATNIANKIPDQKVKDSIFHIIKIQLSKIGKCDEMMELAKTLKLKDNHVLWAFYALYEQVTIVKKK